ncbi:hypothetical protein [Streptomyces sp. NPDC003006]
MLGSVLTEADLFGLGWRPIFLISVPVGLAVTILGRKFIPESTAQKSDRLDLTGLLLSALAMVLIIFPLTEGHTHHWQLWCFAMLAPNASRLTAPSGEPPVTEKNTRAVSACSWSSTAATASEPPTPTAPRSKDRRRGTHRLTAGTPAAPVGKPMRTVICADRPPENCALRKRDSATSGESSFLRCWWRREMPNPVLLLGFGLGMVGGPLADMSLAKVSPEIAGTASGLFNTATLLAAGLESVGGHRGECDQGFCLGQSAPAAPGGLHRDRRTGQLAESEQHESRGRHQRAHARHAAAARRSAWWSHSAC